MARDYPRAVLQTVLAAVVCLGATACLTTGMMGTQGQRPRPLNPPLAGLPPETVLNPRRPSRPVPKATPAREPEPRQPREQADPDPAPAAQPEPADGKEGTIVLDKGSSGVTAELARTREALVMSRATNTRLQRQMAELRHQVAEKNARIAQLELQVKEFNARADALEERLGEWQKDVLGFRNEMRDMSRAQTQILEKVVALLQDLEAPATLPEAIEEPTEPTTEKERGK